MSIVKLPRILHLACLFLAFNLSAIAQDSLKVHVLGSFKNESFRIYYDSLIYTVNMEKPSGLSATSGFTFVISLPKNIEEGMPLNMIIKRKSEFGFLYRDTRCYVVYRKDMNYLVLSRDYMRKDRYPLDVNWFCKPPISAISKKFWKKEDRSWNKAIVSKNENGSICVKGSANDPRIRPGINR